MKAKPSIVVLLALALTVLLVGAVSAQGPGPQVPLPPSEVPPAEPFFPGPEGEPFAAAPEVGAQSVGAASVSLGQPGTVFRHVQTFGETQKGYFEDNTHFYHPSGVATDGISTTVWIADSLGNRAVKFPAGSNAALQQIGKASFREATGTSLAHITDLAVDSSGNIWVVDRGAFHVVKYSSTGQRISELGVAWNPGSDNDHFNHPVGIAFNANYNNNNNNNYYIYVSDSDNHRIQIFVFDSSSNQYVYTATFGQYGNSDYQFISPQRIAIYGDRLYVADAGNNRVQIFDITNPTSPTYVTTLNQFNRPEGVAVDANYIYVADSNNHRVQIFSYINNSYTYSTTIGSGPGDGDYEFQYPTDVAVDTAGNIYVADSGNHRVQQYKYNSSNGSWQHVHTYGQTGVPYMTDNYHYNYPSGVDVAADGSIYIVEEKGHRLVKLDDNGEPQWTVGVPGVAGSDNGHFHAPQDVALDNSLGRVYVADSENHRIQIYSSDGSYTGTLGQFGTGNNAGNYQFSYPTDLAVGQNGYLYVVDLGNHRVQVYDSSLTHVGTIGQTGEQGDDDDHFSFPHDVAVDSSNNVYVVDQGNHRVQKCAPGGSGWTCTTFAGETGVPGYDFGHFSFPIEITVDGAGRVYVADDWGTRIQVFDSSGAYLTTIGGSGIGRRTGQISQARGLAVDSAGNLYVAEILSHRIQKFAPGVPGWTQVNINGFGEPTNYRINSLAPFGGYLYAGTSNSSGNGAQLWRMDTAGNWTAVMTDGFGNATNRVIAHLLKFEGQLYAGTRANETNGGEIWRSSDGINWTRVVSGGFVDPTNGAVVRFGVFNGQIYAGTQSFTDTHGAEIWRSDTGDAGDWEQVVTNGLGDPANYAVVSFAGFNGALYAGTGADVSGAGNGADLWRSVNGQNWTPVITDGFGYTKTYGISALAVFKDYLYAGTGRYDPSTNTPLGGQIWRCSRISNCDEPGDWGMVTGDGFGDPNNENFSGFAVHGEHLYAFVYNLETGTEVWRSQDGTNWERVGEAGLGDSNNVVSNAAVFNNRLYVGTANYGHGGEVWLYQSQPYYRNLLPLTIR